MTALPSHLEAPVVPDRLRERLESLGLCVLTLDSTGRVRVQGPGTPLQQLVASSPLLSKAWSMLDAVQGELPVEVWPGAWLIPLPAGRRRRLAPARADQTQAAVLILTPDVLSSEQLHRICDARMLDFRATVDATGVLPTRDEVRRIARMVAWMRQDSLDLQRRDEELRTMSRQLGESYEELSLLYKLSATMSVNQHPSQFMDDACSELRQVIGLRWMALHLIDDEPRLNDLAGRTYLAGSAAGQGIIIRDVARELLRRQQSRNLPSVVENVASLDVPKITQVASNLLIVPLRCDNRAVGVLLGGDKIDGSHISSVDSKLCTSLASSLAIFLENSMLYEDMHAMFLGTLHALTAAIDAKDSYTHGHSERVAMLSRQLAQAAGLEPVICDRVYIAGLIHDVGKIGVPEDVLCKPGKLTSEEFGLVRMHPEIGARILQDIRQMQDLIPGVLYHHERWDGLGYPRGLSGDDIPIFGRLIALADSFDAMSSNRTYRRSLEPTRVLDEIAQCAGKQFDPHLATLFVKLDFKPFQEMIRRHQQTSQIAKRGRA